MKKWIYSLVFLLMLSCKGENTTTYFTPETALKYFKGIKEICDRDNGALWGKNLYGPIIFIERTNRRIIANMPDKEGLLKGKDGVFTGVYPKELLVSNTPVNYGGTLYAMTPLPTEQDEFRIKNQAIHSLFHRFQKMSGTSSFGYNTNNMDEKEARLWIKLEWKALRKALTTEGEEHIWLSGMLLFSEVPTGNSTRSMQKMKTYSKITKASQHSHIHYFVLSPLMNIRQGSLKIWTVYT